MKITALTGSPRKNGNSAYLAELFIKGADGKGHEVFRFDFGWTSVGEVVASGVWTTGSVCNTDYPQQAYQLGKSL